MYNREITIRKKEEYNKYIDHIVRSNYQELNDCEIIYSIPHSYVAIEDINDEKIKTQQGDWNVRGFKCIDCYKLMPCVDNTFEHECQIKEDGSRLCCTKNCIKKYNSTYSCKYYSRLYNGYIPYINPLICDFFGIKIVRTIDIVDYSSSDQ